MPGNPADNSVLVFKPLRSTHKERPKQDTQTIFCGISPWQGLWPILGLSGCFPDNSFKLLYSISLLYPPPSNHVYQVYMKTR